MDCSGSGGAGRGHNHGSGRLYETQQKPYRGHACLLYTSMAGICGSSGSACTSGSLDPSHVLLAIGLPHEIAHGSLRLTLSEENTKEEMDYVVGQIKEIVAYLRSMSPLYEDYMKHSKQK